jgi:NADPH:quinone reductase-like Zn-dependent oxidoreductase
MKAIVNAKYGSPEVMELKEVEKPTPKDNEVLVKVQAASVNAADWHLLRGKPFIIRLTGYGLFKPKYKILGSDIAGQIEAVGKAVTRFKPGDEVFGDTSGCGLGGFAEYVAVPETVLATKPANISYAHAATAMASLTALQGLRNKGQIKAGKKVLINGASGGVGTFAVQLAKFFGAEVTAVCSSRNLERVRAIGADYVIDYTKEDFSQSGKKYDLILAANGYNPISRYKRALSPKGIYVMVGGSNAQLFQALLLAPFMSMFGSKKLVSLLAKPNLSDLTLLSELLETGKIIPVIDRCYPLEGVASAVRYVEEGHAKGKVIINME